MREIKPESVRQLTTLLEWIDKSLENNVRPKVFFNIYRTEQVKTLLAELKEAQQYGT